MAGEDFLGRLSAPAFLVFVSFILLALSTSRSLSFANAEKLDLRSGSTGHCDLFSGRWMWEPSDPPYINASCSWISSKQNCLANGRPNLDYLNWKWKPFSCDSPNVDAATFLNAMRDKSLLFIGESVIRNQAESLLCYLSQVEQATMVYHDEKWQSKRYYFSSYNFTFGRIWSPFLVASTQKWSYVDLKIALDALDKTWTEEYPKYDYVYLTGGQWYLKEITVYEDHAVVGCHYCPEKEDLVKLDMDYAYRKALRLTYDFMSNSDHSPLIIYRAWVPSHFEHGSWDEGYCNRTRPFKEGEYSVARADPIMRNVEREELERGLRSGLRVKHLDVYYLSLLRPDAHPGPYQNFQPDMSKPEPNDCLHWCLPGLPDTWNQLLMEIILGEENLSSTS